MLYYFQKGKNTTEMQKKQACAVYREGAVTDRMCQSNLQSFLLEISHWMMFQLGGSAEVDSNQTETLTETSN